VDALLAIAHRLGPDARARALFVAPSTERDAWARATIDALVRSGVPEGEAAALVGDALAAAP
jgi:hypothetical protein